MSRMRRLLLALGAALLAALLIIPAAGAAPASSSGVSTQSFGYQESVTFNLALAGNPEGQIVTQETFFGSVSYGTWVLTNTSGTQLASGTLLANHTSTGLTAFLTMTSPALAFATMSFTVNPPSNTGTGTFSYYAFVNGSLQSGSQSFEATDNGGHDFSVSFTTLPAIFQQLFGI